jgi:hypothetical protein
VEVAVGYNTVSLATDRQRPSQRGVLNFPHLSDARVDQLAEQAHATREQAMRPISTGDGGDHGRKPLGDGELSAGSLRRQQLRHALEEFWLKHPPATEARVGRAASVRGVMACD